MRRCARFGAAWAWIACASAAASSCSTSHAGARAGAVPPAPDRTGTAVNDPSLAYRAAGLLVQGSPVPFVGSVRYLRGGSAHSTLMLVALSLANRALTFTGGGALRRAAYDVTLALLRGGVPVRQDSAHEVVRVASLAETLRDDESIVFQRVVAAPPGRYVLRITLRDAGSGAAAQLEQPITVPTFAVAPVAAPIPVYEVTPRTSLDAPPVLISNPRGLVIYARDTTARFYLEAYGPSDTEAVVLRIIDAQGREAARDTVRLAAHGMLSSGVASMPVPRLGGGRLTVQALRPGVPDTASTPLFAAVAEALGPMPLDALASYLRFFAMPSRLAALRDTNPDRRAAAWTALLAAADSAEPRGANEALRAYFARIAVANQRYGDEGEQGWLTDQGRVFVTLGEPDRVLEQSVPGVDYAQRARVWDYVRYSAQLVFVDRTGFGQWRLTPSSNATFSQLASRVRVR